MTAPTLGVLVPALSPTAWVAVVAVLLLVAIVTVVCVVRARRLDRLHRRTDAARAGLADALDRRGAVALRVADALAASGAGPAAPAVRAAADDARHACRTALHSNRSGADASAPRRGRSGIDASARHFVRGGRPAPDQASLYPWEVAENTLTRRLAGIDRRLLPAGLAAELADAEQSVVIARRVHNDAVRDTLDLRSRRLVRWLRLAGTAPVPAYFEIADPQPWQPAAPGTAAPPPVRTVPGVPG